MPNKTFKDILISLLQDTVLCRCLKRLKEAFLNQKRGHLGINRHYYLKPKKIRDGNIPCITKYI